MVTSRKPPKNRGQFRGQGKAWSHPRRRRRYPRAILVALGLALGVLLGLAAIRWTSAPAEPWTSAAAEAGAFTCSMVEVIDGDTFACDSTRIRLQGIDAPELPGHCRRGRTCAPGDPYASTESLRRLMASKDVRCTKTDTDTYGRTVARCEAGGVDLSCAQIQGDFAIRRYADISC